MYTSEMLAIVCTMFGIKSSYRQAEFDRMNLGSYVATNPHIVALVEKGIVKVSANGSLTIDRGQADRVMQSHECPKQYRGLLTNPSLYFKRSVTDLANV